jgi:hypothetical protein
LVLAHNPDLASRVSSPEITLYTPLKIDAHTTVHGYALFEVPLVLSHLDYDG